MQIVNNQDDEDLDDEDLDDDDLEDDERLRFFFDFDFFFFDFDSFFRFFFSFFVLLIVVVTTLVVVVGCMTSFSITGSSNTLDPNDPCPRFLFIDDDVVVVDAIAVVVCVVVGRVDSRATFAKSFDEPCCFHANNSS